VPKIKIESQALGWWVATGKGAPGNADWK